MRRNRLLALISSLAMAGLMAGPVRADVVFSDDFNADNAATVLNFNSLLNWNVSSGTIDYLRAPNVYGIGCVGVGGGCLDLDGSTNNAGRITSKASFNLLAGVTYTLTFDLSGNQRNGQSDTVDFGFGFSGLAQDSVSVNGAAGFATRSLSFTPIADSVTSIFFDNRGGDNIGAILDNVVLRDNRSSVPEPGSLALVALAMIGLSRVVRRRTA